MNRKSVNRFEGTWTGKNNANDLFFTYPATNDSTYSYRRFYMLDNGLELADFTDATHWNKVHWSIHFEPNSGAFSVRFYWDYNTQDAIYFTYYRSTKKLVVSVKANGSWLSEKTLATW